MGMNPKGNLEMESEVYVITTISLVSEERYLIELIEKHRLVPKGRREKWEQRDAYFSGVDDDDQVPSFLVGRAMIPLTVQVSAAEFTRLGLRIGQEVLLKVVPTGT